MQMSTAKIQNKGILQLSINLRVKPPGLTLVKIRLTFVITYTNTQIQPYNLTLLNNMSSLFELSRQG